MIRAPKVRTDTLGMKKPEILGRRPLAILGGDALFPEPLYVARPRVPNTTLFGDLLARVFNSHWFTNDGPLLKQLEERLRLRLGVEFCAAFCNGTIALQAALRSLNLSGEVITTPFTFPATVHAIEWNGLTPVFCDVDRETYNLDPARAAELVTSRTSAILPVHVFGEPCDVIGIKRLAEEKGLKVVYDAAHAFGVSYQGKPIGCWGDLSILSFHATKLFHTCEGGAVVGPQEARFRSLALLRNFGIVDEDEVRGVGLNGKMSELHAATGLCLLDLVDQEIEARGRLSVRYRAGLATVEGLTFQRVAAETTPNYAYQTVEVDPERFGLARDELHLALRAENIITRRYFHPLCSENESYRHLPSAQPWRLPNAHRLAGRILCLPLYGELIPEEVDGIVDCIVAIKKAGPKVRHALVDSRR
jgi:dTDP-4-amino-4,6-dideoxygalactose transaminase